MRRTIAAIVFLFAVATLMSPALMADVSNGEKLARRWCAACHVVAADQREGNTQASPFSAIAKLPSFDGSKLALFLLAPHPPMPDMSLTRAEAADLAAYIVTQGK